MYISLGGFELNFIKQEVQFNMKDVPLKKKKKKTWYTTKYTLIKFYFSIKDINFEQEKFERMKKKKKKSHYYN